MGRTKKIPLIAKALPGYGDEREQRGISISQDAWDKLLKSTEDNSASATLEACWLIIHGVWFGNADATIEHNNDPLHHAASILESMAWVSNRDPKELDVRIIALRDLVLMIREQRLEIEKNQRNIHVK